MRYLFIFILSVLTCCTSGQHYAGNPVIKGWYADPEGLIFKNEYWIFPTYSAPYNEQVYMTAFSSKDLITWEKHGRIIDTSYIKWAWQAMWALSLFRTLANISSPYSVNANGATLRPIFSLLEVPNWFLQSASSYFDNSNIKSSGKRDKFRFTASFNLFVSTP